MTAWACEVNEARVNATVTGADWWAGFRQRMEPVGRITVVTPSLGGDRVHVACASRDDAAWLKRHMETEGIPGGAIKVKCVLDGGSGE